VAKSDGDLRLEVTLDDARAGEAITTFTADGARTNLPALVTAAGASLRKKLGLRDPSAAQAGAARAASPGTPEAAKAYAEGESQLVASDMRGALASFQRAVGADPAFPLAHAGLAMAASSLGDDATAIEEGKKAFETSSALGREEQLMVEARYRIFAKEWDRASEIWRTLFGFFPDNLEYGLRYAQSLWAAGRPSEAFPVILALRALPAPERDDPRIDYYESIAAAKTSDFRRMAAAGKVAAEKAEQIGAWSVAAHGHHQVAEAHSFLHEGDAAIPEWEKAREEYAKIADRQGEADALKGLAAVYADAGDPGRALPMQEASLAMTREIGARYKIANGVTSLGGIRYALGDTAGARALFDEARGLYEAIRDKEGIGNALGNKARTLWDDGDFVNAKAMTLEGRAKLKDVGERDGVTGTTLDLAEMEIEAGDLAGAGAEVQDAEALAKELGIPFYAARCKLIRAQIARAEGDFGRTRAEAGEAQAAFDAAHAGSDVRAVEIFLARVALDEGNAKEAERLAHDVADAAARTMEKQLEATGDALAARALVAQNRIQDASDLVTRASGLGVTTLKVRIDLALARAAVLASAPEDVGAAIRKLTEASAVAEKSSFVATGFDVRLAAGSLARGAGSRRILKALAADAAAKGFSRVAAAADAQAKLVVGGSGSVERR
jgi:tetratricopeptide (TPR) repeat protein